MYNTEVPVRKTIYPPILLPSYFAIIVVVLRLSVYKNNILLLVHFVYSTKKDL